VHVSSRALSSFDERAATWDDDPAKVERARDFASAIRAALLLGPSTRMMEYGAGTGLVTQALRDAVGPVTMVDTSSGMRAVMEDKIASGTITDARVWDLDLTTEPIPDEQFELIVTAMTLHHIADLEPVLAKLAALLVDGGHLCIADLEHEDGSFHGDGFHGHHGFDRSELTSLLTRAGLTDVSIESCGQVVRESGPYPVFLAVCRKPPRSSS
jgi:predicted TPR repeat methyltransferase